MQNYKWPADDHKARKIKMKATHYTLIGLPGDPDQVLYRRSYDAPLLSCVHEEEVAYLLLELHQSST